MNEVKLSLGVKGNQGLIDRATELFLKPIGIQSVDEALQIMNQTKKEADTRGRRYFETATRGNDGVYIQGIESGDLAKGFQSSDMRYIQSEGFVARDFLGTEGNSDRTPFDIDVIQIGNNTSFEWLTKNSTASEYGDVIAVIKNKGDLQETTLENVGNYDRSKIELFKTGVLGDDHYGIRTALLSTQIDYLIFKGTPKNQEQVFFYIAQSGVYTPIPLS